MVRQGERFIDHFQAGFSGHAEIGQHDVKFLCFEKVESFVDATGHRHVVVVFQRLLQTFAGMLLVINDEDTRNHGAIHTRSVLAVKPRAILSQLFICAHFAEALLKGFQHAAAAKLVDPGKAVG